MAAELITDHAPLPEPMLAMVGARSGENTGIVLATLDGGPPAAADVAGSPPRRQGRERTTGQRFSVAADVPVFIARSQKVLLADVGRYTEALEAYIDGPNYFAHHLPEVPSKALLSPEALGKPAGRAEEAAVPAPGTLAADEATKEAKIHQLLNHGNAARQKIPAVVEFLALLCHDTKKLHKDKVAGDIKALVDTSEQLSESSVRTVGVASFCNLGPRVTLLPIANGLQTQIKSVLSETELLWAAGLAGQMMQRAESKAGYDAGKGMVLVLEAFQEVASELHEKVLPSRLQEKQQRIQEQANKSLLAAVQARPSGSGNGGSSGRGRGTAGQKRKGKSDLPDEYRAQLRRGNFCLDLARGHCKYGKDCKFIHDGLPSPPKAEAKEPAGWAGPHWEGGQHGQEGSVLEDGAGQASSLQPLEPTAPAAEHARAWAQDPLAELSPEQLRQWGDFHQLPPLGTQPECAASTAEALAQLEQLSNILGDPSYAAEVGGWGEEEWAAWQSSLAALLPDPDRFQAHSLRSRYWVWQATLQRPDHPRRAVADAVLRRLREGCSFEFVRPDAPEQQLHPRYHANLDRITRLVAQSYGSEAAPAFLDADKPKPIWLPNHRSFEECKPFALEAVGKLASSNSLREWPFASPPRVVLPLGVAVVEGRKPRLVLDAGYVNLFIKYQAFKYEGLVDLTNYLEQGMYGTSTDATSGFYHWSLHPDHWQYVGVCVEGKHYVFTVPAFGLAPAPRWYTEGMQEVYRLVREQGVKMTFMIDDQANWAATQGQAKAQCEALVRLLAALGFYLRPDKCQLRPTLRLRFLGLEVDTDRLRFWVPQDKLQRFAALAEKVLQPGCHVSDRDLARLAGMLLSFMLAVDIAPLAARGLYLAMTGQGRWDELHATPEELHSWLGWCCTMVQRYNGTRMFQRPVTLITVGDASEQGAAAFTPNGELQQAGLGDRFLSSWPDEALPLMRQPEFSSTVREILTPLLLVSELALKAPELVRGRRLQYQTDSQPAAASINGMAGNQWTHPLVRQLWELCKQYDIELEAVWHPRGALLQMRADDLSKQPDRSQVKNSPPALSHVEEALLSLTSGPRRLTVDLFADDYTTQVPTFFFSRHFCPGTSGINAFSQRWDCYWDPMGGRWRRHMGLCNPPFECMGQVIRKVMDDRADVALVYPGWPRYWQQMLAQLQQQGAVELSLRLDTRQLRSDLFQAGPRMPLAPGQSRRFEPRYQVNCAIIIWPKSQWRPAPASHP